MVYVIRFSQFFIEPLFTESGTEREINAVNSEHEKNIPDDDWRMAEIHKKTSNPAHPFNNFGTGEDLNKLSRRQAIKIVLISYI